MLFYRKIKYEICFIFMLTLLSVKDIGQMNHLFLYYGRSF
jgi:hypothetical protein